MQNYALITGASKGIGKCFAEILAKKGYNLVLIARSENELKEVQTNLIQQYSTKVEILSLDLSSVSSVDIIFNFCESNSLPIEILINNAGYGIFGSFEKSDLAEQEKMLRLNMISLVALTHKFIGILKKQIKSYILNVASTAAYQPVPELSTYSASKSFVLSFSRAIAFELKGSSLSVSCLCPGSTKTNFMERAGMKNPKIIATSEKLGMSAELVAEQGIKEMFKGNPEFIPGLVNKISSFFVGFIPKSLVVKIASSIYQE
jgi:short-subunit dehydrogenase